MSTSDPAGAVTGEAYVAGYQDGCTQALRWAAGEWPEDGMTRAEAQAWLEERAALLLCKGHQAASPTRQPCAACIQTATADRRAHLHAWSGDWPADPDEPLGALVRKWEREAADPDGHSLLTQTYRNLARELRAALDAECATCSGRGVWMDEPCNDCGPFRSGCRCCGCAMGDHNDPRQGGGCTNCGDCEGWL